jgi:hypothetical protein
VRGVEVWPGWLTRSRSTGGYDDVLALQAHHDASSTTGRWQDACTRMWETNVDRPVGAMYLRRDGVWVVGAAGATNTSGRGGPMRCSRGTIPLDAANRFVIAAEADNNGVGEHWTAAQLAAYHGGFAGIIAGLAGQGAWDARAKAYRKIRLDPTIDAHAHFEWAPTRKIDPAGPPSPYAIATDRYLRWDMGRFRADLAAHFKPQEAPPMATRKEGSVRILDTRGPDGSSPHPVAAGSARRIGILPPADGWNAHPWAKAVIVDIGVANPRADGFITAWSGDGQRPGTSTQDFKASAAFSNTYHVPMSVGADGGRTISVYVHAETDLVIDQIGWDSVV